MIISEVTLIFWLLKTMKKSLHYYYRRYSKRFIILSSINIFFYFVIGTKIIVYTFYKDLRYEIIHVRSTDNYDTFYKFIWTLVDFIEDILLVLYIYLHLNHIRLRDYVYDILNGMGKLHRYHESSIFIVRS